MMIKQKVGIIAAALGIFLLSHVYAEGLNDTVVSDDAVPENVATAIKNKLKSSRPDMRFDAVERSPIDGLYVVRIQGTQFVYANETGDYIIDGDMYQARPGLFLPVKDLAAANIRKKRMGEVARDDTIVFAAKGETKAVVYVFTDVDCHYCRKLHNEAVGTLNEKGVEVRYLAFPRAGLNSESYKKIASAWCAKDQQSALSTLKKQRSIPENICDNNPVAAQYALGQEVGVTGTPALVMEDGTLLPGFRPAEELLKILNIF